MIIFIYDNRGSVCCSDLESKIHKCSSMKLNVKNIFDRNLQENKRDKIQLTWEYVIILKNQKWK